MTDAADSVAQQETTDEQVRRLPITFAIVGVQKAATSSLYALLVQHRQIARGPTKERHFFDDESRDWDHPDYTDYHTVSSKPSHRIAGDATPIYLFWPRALERMRAYNPDMRLIASFRDPIERAFSQWSMERDRAASYVGFGHAIRDDRYSTLPDVEAVTTRSRATRTRTLVARGLYGQQLRRAFELFEPDQWLMLNFRDLLADKEGTLDRVTDFLGVSRYRTYPPLKHKNAGTTGHRGLPPTGDDIARLAEFYADDLADFTKLSGVDTAAWPTSQILAGTLEPAEFAAKLARRAGLEPATTTSIQVHPEKSGPDWLGIGAHACGTGWLTDLVVRHPDVVVGTNGRREQQALHQIARGELDEAEYADLFPADGLYRGEFTPRYLNNASAPAVAARVIAPEAPVVVIVRDPVERFAAAMLQRAASGGQGMSYEAALTYHQWCGMYAPQLDLWASTVGRDRMLVYTYEEVLDDPEPMCREIWTRLGLSAVELTKVPAPSSSTTDTAWEWPEGLRDALICLYRPQLAELAERWGVRTDLWQSL